jgi:predicted alpha-1,6-mannanase (GH76 family)
MRLATALALCASTAAAAPSYYAPAATVLADRLTACSFSPPLGIFVGEQLWQSGATMETVANVLLASPPPRLQAALQQLLNASFDRTPVIVDNCLFVPFPVPAPSVVLHLSVFGAYPPPPFPPLPPLSRSDDHQWWGLAWARAFTATGTPAFLQRAAAVFDFVAQRGWNTSTCGGGVTWCPPPTSPYKNAITAELFLSLAMALHPHAAAAGKAPDFYSGWANTTFQWIAASGMVNAQSLLNDGLDGATCKNNGQPTWTYNQGVLLSGLARLTAATGAPAPLALALRVATATMSLLTEDGILVEPCPGGACGQDGEIFKGMFVKHLAYLLQEAPPAAAAAPPLPPAFVASATAFLAANAASLLAQDACRDGGYGFRWEGSACDIESVATDSAALDLLLAAAAAGAPAVPPLPLPQQATWQLLGLGNCQDAGGRAMSNCFKDSLTAQACRDAAFVTPGAVAYDFHLPCLGEGLGFCRVRTGAGAGACSGGFSYEGGSGAAAVTAGDGSALAACYLRNAEGK